MKPDWKDAPKWANWLAIDSDEDWFWYAAMPTKGKLVWFNSDVKPHMYAGTGGSNKDWRDTLEERPDEIR